MTNLNSITLNKQTEKDNESLPKHMLINFIKKIKDHDEMLD